MQLSFEYLMFLINRAKTLSEKEAETHSVQTLALVEDVSVVVKPVKAPTSDITSVPILTLVEDMPAVSNLVKTITPKRTRKMSKPMGFTTTVTSTKRRGKPSTLTETA